MKNNKKAILVDEISYDLFKEKFNKKELYWVVSKEGLETLLSTLKGKKGHSTKVLSFRESKRYKGQLCLISH